MTLLLRKSSKASRGTPPFSASTVISAMYWVTTPSMMLWQIFTRRALLAVADVGDVAAEQVEERLRPGRRPRAGPELTRLSLPAETTLPLPLTGEARKAMPRASARPADARRRLGRDRRAVDEDAAAPRRGRRAGRPRRQTCSRSAGGRDHREDDVAVGQLGRLVGDLGAGVGQGLGLAARAVPDGEVQAGPADAGGQRGTHVAGADPADGQRGEVRTCHREAPSGSVMQSFVAYLQGRPCQDATRGRLWR